MQDQNFYRGDIYMAFFPRIGKIDSAQYGTRPVLIVQNDIGNKYSPNIIVAPITTKTSRLPTHVSIEGFGLLQRSTVSCESICTISKARLLHRIGTLGGYEAMEAVDQALINSLGL